MHRDVADSHVIATNAGQLLNILQDRAVTTDASWAALLIDVKAAAMHVWGRLATRRLLLRAGVRARITAERASEKLVKDRSVALHGRRSGSASAFEPRCLLEVRAGHVPAPARASVLLLRS
jgi:uncharacterized protein YaiI (UPF0178 family)